MSKLNLEANEWNKILLEGGELLYISQFLSEVESKVYFQHFLENAEWQEDDIKIFGKTYQIPRLQAWYGDPDSKYSYSNIELDPKPWTKELIDIRTKIKKYTEESFNSVLLNLYRNGQDSNGWHSDDEKELGPCPIIASITLGQERIFHMKHKTLRLKKSFLLENGSLLIMQGATQKNWKHQIPKTAKDVNPRINLTFRRIFT